MGPLLKGRGFFVGWLPPGRYTSHMKHLILCLMMTALFAGCSKEEGSSEQLGRDAAERIKKPIEDARAISEKARETREVDLPQ